jgi:putative ABC transport system substrate-binding protein
VGLLIQNLGALEAIRSALLPELEKQGFVEGKNLVVDVRAGAGEALPGLARELLEQHPKVLVTSGSVALASASALTSTVPIVTFGANPVDLGFSQSMSRPGSNVTGVVILVRELNAKRLELLHEAFPSSRRVAALVNPRAPGAAASRREMSTVAEKAGTELVVFEASGRADYPEAFAGMSAAGASALAIAADPQFNADAAHLAQLAIGARLPTVCQWREMADQGCLLSYGPSYRGLWVLMARYVGTILKGASVKDLPVEQPTTFELVVNAATAKALGITVPASLLARADEVIE